ncbi:MAG: hypothetical protein ACOC16_00910 [Nanoarchaeota archaeon]
MTQKNNQKDGYESLYICMQNYSEKKKNILLGIQSALVMQEEHQKVIEIRKNKSMVTKEIKQSLDDINKLYIQLKKELPNVKNFLSSTKKEINELDGQINVLNKSIKAEKQTINLEKKMKSGLIKSNKSIRETKQEEQNKQKNSKPEQKIIYPNTQADKNDKLNRIQNNLKVIESKLKGL